MAKITKPSAKSSTVHTDQDDESGQILYSSVAALNAHQNNALSNNANATTLPSVVVAKQPEQDSHSAPDVSTHVQIPSSEITSTPTRSSSAESEQNVRGAIVTVPGLPEETGSVTSLSSANTSPSTASLALAATSPIIIYTGASVTLDESEGLQNAATSTLPGDANDNDIATASLPTAFSTRLAALGAGTPLNAAESGYNGVTGQNVFTIDPTAVVDKMTLTDASGQLLNGLDSDLKTVDGRHIYLFNDSVNTDIVLGKTTGGEIVFAVYLQEQSTPVYGGQLWTVLYEPLFHPDATNPDDSINLAGKVSVTVDGASKNALGDATPGQHLFFMVGSEDAGLVVTGYHPANQSNGAKIGSGDTVNVSHAGTGGSSIGTNNQMINSPTFDKSGKVTVPGEGMIFTFVTGPNSNYTGVNLSQAEADVEANIQFTGLKNSDSAYFLVSQLQPTKAATLEISALNTALETGVNYVDGLLVNDTAVNISRVVVMNTAGGVLADSNGSVTNPKIGFTFTDGHAYVSGVLAGYQIQYYTTGTHNRVLIQNSGSTDANLNASFDIGNFSFVGFTHASADVGSLIAFEDSGPSVDVNTLVHLDDAAMPGGSGGGTGDVSGTTGTLAHNFGTDGPGSIAWLGTGAPAGFSYVVSGTTLYVLEGSTTVMTLTLNAATGAYTVVQNAAVMHVPGEGTNSEAFTVNYQVLDQDHDPVKGILVIAVKDDIPSVASNLLVSLDDAAMAGGSGGGTGDIANTSGVLAHSYGADGSGTLGWITTGAPSGFTYETSGSNLLIKEAGVTVVTLTLDPATGAYTVTQNAAVMHAPAGGTNSLSFSVGYEVTDKDLDPVGGVLVINVKDDIPSVTSNLLVHLDDGALPGGSGSGSGDIANTSGVLAHSYGADGSGSIAWLTTGAPAGFTYQASGSDLLIKEGGVTVLTLTLNPATGAYTVTQNAVVMHAPGDGTNAQAFAVSYEVIDKDSDPVDGVLNISVRDDVPTVDSNLLVRLDDAALAGGSGGGSGDVANTTGVLAHSYGADGAGSIAWLTTGAPAGFTYEASGSNLLIKEAGVTVATLTLDPSTGAYTVVQNVAVMHAPVNGTNAQVFAVNYEVYDKDTDPVDGVLNISIKDDIPTVASNLLVQMDDAALPGGSGGGSGDVANTTGILAHSYGADGAGTIAWLATGAPAGYAYETSGSSLLIKEAGVTVMTLTLDPATGGYTVVQNAALMHAPVNGINSETFTVSYEVTDKDSDVINGVLNIFVKDDIPTVASNLLVQLDDAALAGGSGGGSGDVANTAGVLAHGYGADGAGSIVWLSTGAPDGYAYEISGDNLLIKEAGVTVMTLALDPATGGYSVAQNAHLMHSPGNGINSQAFAVSYQVTDKDSDFINGVLNITVKDDIPSVTSNLVTHLDDAALPGGSGGGSGDVANTSGVLAHTYGADGAGSITWHTTGAPAGFTYEAAGSNLLIKESGVTVVTLTLDTATGAYTVVQNAAVLHAPDNGTNSQVFDVSYQVLDQDSDSVDGVLSITVKDDIPSVTGNLIVHLDDAALAGGSGGGTGDIANTTGVLGHSFGADGSGSMNWLTTGAPAGFTYEATGSTLQIKEAGATVITVTMDPVTGSYSVVQNAALMHAPGDGANSQAFSLGYQVSDKDADPVDGVLNITVKDDMPSVGSNLMVSLDDAALPGGSGGGTVLNTTGILAHNFGADGAGTVEWLNTGAPAGFTFESTGSTLLVKEAGVTVMTLTVNETTGAYTVTQNAPLVHAAGDGANYQVFDMDYRVMDKDSDPSTGTLIVAVKDDIPSVGSNVLVHLDDAALPGGSGGGTGDVQNTTGTLSHNYEADGAGSIVWDLAGAPTGFTYQVSGNNLLVIQDARTVITLTVDPVTGAYTVVQNAAVDHALGSPTQNFEVTYTIADKDQDLVNGVLDITVKDDVPTGSYNPTVLLDDAVLTGGSGGIAGSVAYTSGILDHRYNADGAGTVSWLTAGAPSGYTYESSGTSLLVKEGGLLVMTVSMTNPATGEYLVVQNAPLHHAAGLGTNQQDFTFTYLVTDHDGSTDIGPLNVSVKDDVPTVTANPVVHLDDAVLTGGNGGGVGDVLNTSGIISHHFGADGAGSIAWLATGAPTGFAYEVSGSQLLVKEGATTVMTLGLDSATGAYTVVQNAAILHAPGGGLNSQAFTVGYQVIDQDSDPVNGVLDVTVKDDAPLIHAISDVSYANTDNPTPGGSGVFSYSIGADFRSAFSSSNSDFSIFSLLGQVGKNSITNSSALWQSEDSKQATFALAFDYQPNENSTVTEHATGTLQFNKTAGTYSIALNAPIDGYSISTTSSALAFTGYEPNSSVLDHTQPAVSVAQLTSSLYAQFTGISEPGGGTDANNLQAVAIDGSVNNFVDGELFTQAASWVSTSNLANGVAGDTLQKGEVLDFNLYQSNPEGYLNTPATVQATSIFLKFDGVGKENLVTILKLVDSVDGSHTTKALVIDNEDILKAGNTITPNYGINLDSNDGAVVIESNDFNAVGQHYLITGAQLMTSTEGITGTAINFNSAIGAAGASTTTVQMGAATTDNDVIKISDIGIITEHGSTLDSNLHIALAVKDADVDATATQILNVTIAGNSSSASLTLADLTHNVAPAQPVAPASLSAMALAPSTLPVNEELVHAAV